MFCLDGCDQSAGLGMERMRSVQERRRVSWKVACSGGGVSRSVLLTDSDTPITKPKVELGALTSVNSITYRYCSLPVSRPGFATFVPVSHTRARARRHTNTLTTDR